MSEVTLIPAQAFDYGSLDTETRIVVQQRAGEIKTIARRAATDIIEIGGKLSEVKDRLGHGRFGAWLEAEFAWQERTAQSFMAVAERFKSANIADLNFAPTALYMLSAPSVPDAARAEAIRYAEAGERITVAKAQAIVNEYKPAPAPTADVAALATADQVQAAVRAWLGYLTRNDQRASRLVLQQIALNNAVGLGHLDKLIAHVRAAGLRALREDVRRAALVVHAELTAAEAQPGRAVAYAPADASGLRSAADVQAAAATLEPAIWRWLAVPETAHRADWEKADRLLASVLDLEGFHAARGRNFDLEALVGDLGAACDREALPVAVRAVRTAVQQRLAALPEPEPEPAETADVIAQWLTALAEENEIPTTRAGEPERDAVRTLLKGILTDRANGGGRYWRSLSKHPAWPDGTADAEKLAAVRVALAEMTGAPEPVAVPQPARWADAQPGRDEPRTPKDATTALIMRKDQHIRHLVVAVDKALGYLGSLAEQRNGEQDADLLECISALRLARAEALNED